MNRFIGIIMLSACLGASLLQGAVTSVKSDPFSDGSRNTSLWSLLEETNAVLVESTGQLHFISDGPDALPFRKALWKLNFSYPVQVSYQIESIVRVRLPHLIAPGAPEDTEIASGLGWRNPDGSRSLSFQILDTRDGRVFRFLKVSPGGGLYSTLPVPDASPVLDLRMLFKSTTHTVSFFWRKPGETAWNRVFAAEDLNALWELSENYKIIPFIGTQAYGFPAYWSDKLTLDNFSTTTYSK